MRVWGSMAHVVGTVNKELIVKERSEFVMQLQRLLTARASRSLMLSVLCRCLKGKAA